MSTPRATYRAQLCRDFAFKDAAALVPYLAALGISTLYCSPILQARTGSAHGYDTTDPTRLSEELGGQKGWRKLCARARRHGLSLLLDIVPNHMAGSVENPWWRNILQHGRLSPYAEFFDIDWTPPEQWLHSRVLLPVLTTRLPEAMAKGHLEVGLSSGGLTLRYGGLELPLDVRSCGVVLESAARYAPSRAEAAVLASFARRLRRLRPVVAAVQNDPVAEHRRRERLAQEMLRLLNTDSTASLVAEASDALTLAQMRRLLGEQSYVLQWWKDARNHLNYRRFFAINDLVGVKVEDRQVFTATHRKLALLTGEPAVCGFRVDHVDGLLDPVQYLERLRALGGSKTPYLVVEKILSGDEVLPPDWPVDGTTGYEFLNEVNGLFVNELGLAMMERHYRRATRTRSTRRQVTHRNRRMVIKSLFNSEISRLSREVAQVVGVLSPGSSLGVRQLREALVKATARLPVYRTYFRCGGVLSAQDQARLSEALGSHATDTHPAGSMVRRVLTLDVPQSANDNSNSLAGRLLCRWQQLTGAVMAKGFEDTTLYQDTVLLSLNDVGSRPDHAVTAIADFHRWNQVRLRDWPTTLNCTATHDTKRGEDVRARLNVLSEMPDAWLALANRWLDLTASACPEVDAATALLLLQTLVGTWPERDPAEVEEFRERVKQYLVKAAREAKTHSNWLKPDVAYEGALQRLADTVLGDSMHQDMRDDIEHMARTIAFHGSVNAVAQTVLKAMCPGVPDFYQGTELWELSMVDPDNRRPVDYGRRSRLLKELTSAMREDRLALADELMAQWPEPRAKLLTTQVALRLRRESPTLFEKGDYVPLEADGKARNHIVSFSRSLRDACVLVVVPVQSRALAGAGRLPLSGATWGNDGLKLAPGLPQVYEDAFTGSLVAATSGRLLVADVLARFPVSILVPRQA